MPLAAATAALSLVAAAQPALAEGGAGDVPPYAVAEDARRIEGAASSGDGPRIEPGTYTDTLGPGDKKFYRVDLDGKSSAFISAVAAPESGSPLKNLGNGMTLKLESADGSACGESGPQAGAFGYPVADYASRVIGADDDCQRAGSYLFSVEREDEADSDPARWPLEIRYMSEPGLKGGPGSGPSAAPSASAGAEATPAPYTGGAERRAHGGSGFSGAGALAEGVWKDRIRPGETRFYRVPVDWGQRLNATAELGSAPSPGEYPQTYYDGLRVAAFNPARGLFDDVASTSYSPDKSAQAQIYTPSVEYARRFDYSGSTGCVAGWHYLAVSVTPELAEYFGKTGVPLTLRVDVAGKVEAGPSYDGDERKAGFGVGADDLEQAEKGQTAAEAERSATLRAVGFTGIGTGAALLLVLAVWTVLARRGAGAASAGVAGQGGPGGQGGPAGHTGTLPLRRR